MKYWYGFLFWLSAFAVPASWIALLFPLGYALDRIEPYSGWEFVVCIIYMLCVVGITMALMVGGTKALDKELEHA